MPSTFLVRYFLLTKIYSLYHTHSHSGFPTMLECRYLSVHPSETQRSGERATQPDHEDSAFLSNRMAHTHINNSQFTHTHTHTHIIRLPFFLFVRSNSCHGTIQLLVW
jgi:hypothetical protein